jgi:hypothetical protein
MLPRGGFAVHEQLAQALAAVRAGYFDAAATACDYGALVASREHGRLTASLAALFVFDPRKLRIPAQTAFWLNVYNACVLRDAREIELTGNAHETEGFFDRERARIGGHTFSLDDIEHGLLRGNAPKYGRMRAPMKKDDPRLGYMPLAYDERMHFAMYSACRSSPALRVFDGEHLEAQLEQAARDYLERTVRVEKEGALIVVPKLFLWYAADFGGEKGVLEFVLARQDDATVDLVDRRRGKVKLQYCEFDWSLNRK